MKVELRHAIWAAVYVEVLSARGGQFSIPEDYSIHSVAESLSDPTQARMDIAIQAANRAVDKLEERGL